MLPLNMEEVKLQIQDEKENSISTNNIIKEDPPDTFGIPGEIFNHMTPLCLRIAHDPDLRDESDEEEDDDEEFSSMEIRNDTKPPMVTVEGHFCEPKVNIKEGKRMLIPSCSPFNKSWNGGGNIRLRQLRREANIWPFYNESNVDKRPCVRNYFNRDEFRRRDRMDGPFL